jgi:signal transduction histidine kinase
MEAGARRYNFETCDCTELVGGVVNAFRQEAYTSRHAIEFHGNGSAAISADREALSRAIWNLLDNAVKYSPDRQSIQAAVERCGRNVKIAVQDHGIGIPVSERAAIFFKFQRGEQARKRGIKGTGIGLAIVNEIVKAHRGRVEVESRPGAGSTFTIVLPAKE